MTVQDYAKYVVENMGRATLTNALNIVKSIYGEGAKYPFDEFLSAIIKIAGDLVANKRLPEVRAYQIIVLADEILKKLSSDTPYKPNMLADEFIIRLWNYYQ